MVTRTAMGASQWASSIFPALDQVINDLQHKPMLLRWTFKRKKSLTKHRRKKSKDSKEPVQNSSETRRLLNHVQGHGRAKENWDKWIWNRDSPSRVWFGFFWLRCRRSPCPDNYGPDWQLHWIKSTSIDISELRRPRRCFKDVGGEPTSPTSLAGLWHDLGLDTLPRQNPLWMGIIIDPSRLQSLVDVG